MNYLQINATTIIPESELSFSASRSSGPGGQNVNKVNTKVTLEFDVRQSPNLSDAQKELLLQRLGSRLTKDGVLIIQAQNSRSQQANKRAAIERFIEIMRQALIVQRKRRRRKPSLAARYERLRAKRHRSEIKQNRRRVDF